MDLDERGSSKPSAAMLLVFLLSIFIGSPAWAQAPAQGRAAVNQLAVATSVPIATAASDEIGDKARPSHGLGVIGKGSAHTTWILLPGTTAGIDLRDKPRAAVAPVYHARAPPAA